MSSQPKPSWTARIMTGLAVLFLTFDTVIKFVGHPEVTKAFGELGIPVHLGLTIATIEAISLTLYLVPRTAVFGLVLLTGFLGGSTLAQLRIEAPLFSHILFPSYIGLLLWGGLYLREPRLRALVPLR